MEQPHLPAPYDPAQGNRALEWKPRVDTYVIVTAELRVAASDDLAAVKALRQDLEESRLAIVRHHRAIVEAETGSFKTPIEVCDYAIERLTRLMLGWDNEQDRKRRAIEAQQRAEAAAEQARKDAAAKAERDAAAAAARDAEAAKQRALAAQQQLDQAIDQGDSASAVVAATEVQQAQQQAAQQAVVAAESAERAHVASAAVYEIAAPIMTPAPAKIAGESKRENWHAEVTDPLALIKAIAALEQPLSYIEFNLTALNGVARSLKAEFRVPGCIAVNTPGLATRRKA